jgi:hypothetical protein
MSGIHLIQSLKNDYQNPWEVTSIFDFKWMQKIIGFNLMNFLINNYNLLKYK